MKKFYVQNSLTILILSLITILIFNGASIGLCSYNDQKNGENFKITARGMVVKKIEDDVAVAKLIAPEASIEIQNISSSSKTFDFKLKNVNTAIYRVNVDNGKMRYKGERFAVYQLFIPPGKTEKIVVSPRLKNTDKFSFAVLGDSRSGTHIHKKLLEQIEDTEAIFAINLGDIVNRGAHWEYVNYVKEISDFSLPYFVAIGNHEIIYPGGRQMFVEYVNPLNYSFTLGKFNFIIIDDSRGTMTGSQYSWLEEQLKAHKNNFVFLHMPPCCPIPRFEDHLMRSRSEMKKFMNLMEKHRVKAVFGGHVHGYCSQEKDGVQYIISACAGASPYMLPSEGGFYHFVLVRVDGDRFSTEVHKLDRD